MALVVWIPNQGVKIIVLLTYCTALIGVEFAWAKFGSSKSNAHKFVARALAFFRAVRTDFHVLVITR